MLGGSGAVTFPQFKTGKTEILKLFLKMFEQF